MPRYIDADKYLNELDKQICSDCFDDGHCCSCGVGCARGIAREMPTADVAPKSEAIQEYLAKVLEKKDTASHYAPGTEVVTVDVLEYYANTMTEGKNDG